VTAEAAIYPRLEAEPTVRGALPRQLSVLKRSLAGAIARIALAFALVAAGGILAPLLAADGPRSAGDAGPSVAADATYRRGSDSPLSPMPIREVGGAQGVRAH